MAHSISLVISILILFQVTLPHPMAQKSDEIDFRTAGKILHNDLVAPPKWSKSSPVAAPTKQDIIPHRDQTSKSARQLLPADSEVISNVWAGLPNEIWRDIIWRMADNPPDDIKNIAAVDRESHDIARNPEFQLRSLWNLVDRTRTDDVQIAELRRLAIENQMWEALLLTGLPHESDMVDAMAFAIKSNNLHLVELFCLNGGTIKPNYPDWMYDVARERAIAYGNLNILIWILQQDGEDYVRHIAPSLLSNAVQFDHAHIVKYMLSFVEKADLNGPVLSSVRKHNHEILKILLEAGASQSALEFSALRVAVQENSLDCVKVLLNRKIAGVIPIPTVVRITNIATKAGNQEAIDLLGRY